MPVHLDWRKKERKKAKLQKRERGIYACLFALKRLAEGYHVIRLRLTVEAEYAKI
jgi:hypothetical protein